MAKSFDNNYGVSRKEDADSGYVIFADNQEDLELICELEIDAEGCTSEYAEEIETAEGTYINTLFLLNNEFAVTLLTPKNIMPQNILEII